MIVGPLIPPGVIPVLLSVIFAHLATKWIVPVALTMLAKALQGAIVGIAALLILPEYHWSRARRRRNQCPPQLAYDYGAAVGWTAWHTSRVTGLVLRGLARVLRAIPAIWIALVTTAVATGWLLGLITI